MKKIATYLWNSSIVRTGPSRNSILTCNKLVLAYMAINIDFDNNKPHVLIEQRIMNYAFIIRKLYYGIKVFWTKMKALLKSLIVFLNFRFGPI